MTMPVMEIRKVRVPMHHRRMPMQMGVGLAWRITRFVIVQVVQIVNMPMIMLKCFMRMFVIVSLG